jgi:hypothetical protein
MKTRNCLNLLVPALLIAVSGCGGSGLYKASGRLTYKGQPVPSTFVIFQPEEPGKRASRGVTDDSGNFTVTYSSTEKGMLPGKHTVVLQYHLSAQEEIHEVPPKASKELRTVIDKYGDVKKSTLHYEAKKSGEFFDIKLE